MSLMAGDEEWDSAEVKQVFDTWREPAALPPGRPAGPHVAGGRDVDGQGRVRHVPARHVRRRRASRTSRTTSTSSPSPSSTARSAPTPSTPRSTASCLAASAQEPGRAARRCSSGSAPPRPPTRPTRTRRPLIAANSGADTSVYSALQKKSAEVVGAADEHRPVPRPRHPRRLRLDGDDPVDADVPARTPTDIDGVTKSIQEQKESIFI